jgi:hypothetical protein
MADEALARYKEDNGEEIYTRILDSGATSCVVAEEDIPLLESTCK